MILDKFLNLQGTSIQGYLHLENIGIVCRIESKNQKATCPHCGLESDKLHQNHRHLVKDLPISGQPVYLQVNRRQFKCNNCRTADVMAFCQRGSSVILPFTRTRKRGSHRH